MRRTPKKESKPLSKKDETYKFVLLGDSGVGKTSVAVRYFK
jgi:GTPase SAR1 family protein